jgi:hypothetical protein
MPFLDMVAHTTWRFFIGIISIYYELLNEPTRVEKPLAEEPSYTMKKSITRDYQQGFA